MSGVLCHHLGLSISADPRRRTLRRFEEIDGIALLAIVPVALKRDCVL